MSEWHPESNPAHYDAAKKSFFAHIPAGAVRMAPAGDYLPGTWWRLESEGEIVGYGWMDVTWGDAQIMLAVRPDTRGAGHGGEILEHLEREAAHNGLGYLFNTIPADHPDPDGVRAFLTSHGFEASGLDGHLLRKRVRVS